MSRQGKEREIEGLFRRMRETADPGQKEALREEIISANEGLVRALARKFSQRGEPMEDLIQIGMIGLINAVDGFDPSRGNRFTTFAHPTILGEIKRHFRDKGWWVRVPRGVQELKLAVGHSIDRLSHELMRDPKISEIAADLGVSEEQVVEAAELDYMYNPVSLDGEWEEQGQADWQSKMRTEVKGDWERILTVAKLGEALESLGPRQRAVIKMRFFGGLTQTEIARRLKVSQMYVSRLQQKGLRALRQFLEGETVGKR